MTNQAICNSRSETNTVKNPLTLFPAVENLPKRYSNKGFNNFEKDLQDDAFLRAYNFIKNPNPEVITLTGETGTGKTHLAVAMLRNFPKQEVDSETAEKQKKDYEDFTNYAENEEVREGYRKLLDFEAYKYRKARCLYLSTVEFFIEANEKVANNAKSAYFAELNRYDCILLDDLGAEKLSDATRQNLYHIIDLRYRECKSLIVTSNFTIEQINAYEPRIASRLAEMGDILHLVGDDYRLSRRENGN